MSHVDARKVGRQFFQELHVVLVCTRHLNYDTVEIYVRWNKAGIEPQDDYTVFLWKTE
jgi:hypothetical protein